MKDKGILIVISGFSGAGKGTLVKKLMETHDDYVLSISMTTRSPRVGEENGREYFFVTRDEFEKTIEEDGLVEYASYCDNYYGTPKAYVEEQIKNGKNVILEIELQGALKIKKKFPQSLLMFVTPPSAEVLYGRLVGRGTETEEVIKKRMARAVEESFGIENYDFIVENDDLEECVATVHSMIEMSKCAPDRCMDYIEQMRKELVALSKGEK